MTKDGDIDELARQLAQHASERERATAPLDDDVLSAYREGQLDATRAAAVEAQLARDPTARERLLRLSDVAPPPPAVRAKVLDAAGPARPWTGRLALAAVAAGLAVAMGVALWTPSGSSDWPAQIEAGLAQRAFELSLTGLAQVRSASETTPEGPIVADLDTTLRARMASDVTLPVPLYFGVFVQSDTHWSPVAAATVESFGSAADITLTPRAAGATGSEVLTLVFVASGAPLPQHDIQANDIDARWHYQRRTVNVAGP